MLISSATIAALGWTGLFAEAVVAHRLGTAAGFPLRRTTFIFLRFFTNLTTFGVAMLMSVTAWRAHRCRPLPPARTYAAATVYILVVSLTYEILLRRLWSPRGITLLRDALMHDVVPASTLLFWLIHAPKRPLSWRDPLRWLGYPAAYLGIVLAAGRAGHGYPYAFLDAKLLGARSVSRTTIGFAAGFCGVGLVLVGAAKLLTRGEGK